MAAITPEDSGQFFLALACVISSQWKWAILSSFFSYKGLVYLGFHAYRSGPPKIYLLARYTWISRNKFMLSWWMSKNMNVQKGTHFTVLKQHTSLHTTTTTTTTIRTETAGIYSIWRAGLTAVSWSVHGLVDIWSELGAGSITSKDRSERLDTLNRKGPAEKDDAGRDPLSKVLLLFLIPSGQEPAILLPENEIHSALW